MQPFLNERENVAVMGPFDVDDAIRVQTRLSKPGPEQVAAAEAPENRTFEAGCNPGDEEAGCPGELRAGARFDHLVQSAECQALTRQVVVEGLDPKRQTCSAMGSTLQMLDLPPQVLDCRQAGSH